MAHWAAGWGPARCAGPRRVQRRVPFVLQSLDSSHLVHPGASVLFLVLVLDLLCFSLFLARLDSSPLFSPSLFRGRERSRMTSQRSPVRLLCGFPPPRCNPCPVDTAEIQTNRREDRKRNPAPQRSGPTQKLRCLGGGRFIDSPLSGLRSPPGPFRGGTTQRRATTLMTNAITLDDRAMARQRSCAPGGARVP